jgi:transcriptional regulator with XRE-family HTH domain
MISVTRVLKSIPVFYGNTDMNVNRQTDNVLIYCSGMDEIEKGRTPFGKRMYEARLDAGYTQQDVERLVGIKQSTLSDMETIGKRSGYTSQLAALYGYNPVFLATGKGEKKPSTIVVQDISPAIENGITIPVFDHQPSAGRGSIMQDSDTVIGGLTLNKEWLHKNVNYSRPNNLAVLTAYGDSMSPTFNDGDILLVDRGVEDIRIDAVYVIALNDELFVKRVQRGLDGSVLVKSDNPLYDPYRITEDRKETLQVLGRVLWSWNGKKL